MGLFLTGVRGQAVRVPKGRASWGVGFAIGGQGLMHVDYRHRIGVLMPEMRKQVRERGVWRWDVMVQPQWVFVTRRANDMATGEDRAWELGLSGGLSLGLRRPRSYSMPYVGMAIGPHFLSGSIPRQSAGPAFCSQLFAGIRRRMGPRFEWELRGGFRHVSNAGMSSPNGGINHSFLGMWLSRRG
jgi:hypothetical protein